MTKDLSKLWADEAEGYVVGGLLVDPGAYHDVAAVVTATDFRNELYRDAFEKIGEQVRAGKAVDAFIIGYPEFMELGLGVPNFTHLVEYAEQVTEFALRRQTVREATEAARDAFDLDKNVYESRVQCATKLTKFGAPGKGAVHVTKWVDDGNEYLVDIRDNPREHAGFTTGLGDLDKVFGDGLLPGMNLLMGEPGLGKTILAQQITMEQVKNDIPVAFYSGEMIWRDMFLRLLSAESKIKVSAMRKGDYWDQDWDKIIKAGEKLKGLPLWVDDPRDMTTTRLRSDLTRLKMDHGIKVMVFDYLGKLVDLKGVFKDEWKRSTELAYRLQPILVDLDIAGLIVHQTNKEGFKKPSMGGISGGGGVAFEAVCAVQIMPGEEDNLRKIINIKPPRGVEGYWHSCKLFKDPMLPMMGQVVAKDDKEQYQDYTV